MIFALFYGSNKMIQKDSLSARYPELITEWNYEKNGDLQPQGITAMSHKKVWWKCPKGHEWEAAVSKRAMGRNCPYCSGRYAIKGETDLATTYPSLVSEWHPYMNKGLTPDSVTAGSGKQVWWKCQYGHEWQAIIVNRTTHKRGCPYCARRLPIQKENDLGTINPKLANEWNASKNGLLVPEQVLPGSHKKVWWKCEHGHEWKAQIKSRVSGNGCPYCANQKVLVGYNDLSTTNPSIAAEWCNSKNGELLPQNVTAGSTKKVWWQCSKGHEWNASITSRSHMKSGCPICAAESQTSFPEQAILYYMKRVTVAESRYKGLGKEIDVYLPKYRVGIEYNGYWHKDRKKADSEKLAFFAGRGIHIITITEGKDNCIVGDRIEYIYHPIHRESLDWVIKTLFKKLDLPEIVIDTMKDEGEITDQYITMDKDNNLELMCPELAAEWNFHKNGRLSPTHVTPGSGKKVWWKCQLGHEWRAAIYSRTSGNGCPICDGKKVLEGFNDLRTKKPELAKEWNYDMNGELTPQSVTSQSHKKVWWRCEFGHEWEAAIANRFRGQGCSVCAKRANVENKN